MSRLRGAITELRTNPEQWEAFQHQGHCVVLAPPGSGKTKLLTTKAVWLASNSVGPSQGLSCITLTNPAASEMRGRIRALGQPIGRRVNVGTVHSFAWSGIIRPFAPAAGLAEWARYSLAPQQQARAAMRQAIHRVFGQNADTRFVDSTIKRNRKLCLSEDEWMAAGSLVHTAALEYERLLRDQDYVDFDSVVAMAVHLVEQHSFVRKVLHARYPFLMVDEYQDLAPGLHRIVSALSLGDGGSTLFAVGDPDQAIYGWTGTRPELLLDLADDETVHRVDLRINYRCGAVIAEAGRRILGAPDGEAVTIRGGGSVTVRREPEGLSAQATYIAERIDEFRSEGLPLHEIAVLAPTNGDCDEIVRVLRERDIPVSWRSDAYAPSPLTMGLEAFAAWVAHGREQSGYRLGDLLDEWQQLGDRNGMKAGVDRLVSVLLEAVPDAAAGAFVERVLYVLESIGAMSELRSDDVNEMSRMQDALSAGGEMEAFTVRELGNLRLRDGRVEVATMSSSKGLEFDHVFIAGLEEGKLPFYKSHRGSAEWREDRRKFYVSFTRARESVEVLYSGWYETPWGRKVMGASAFLRESGLLN